MLKFVPGNGNRNTTEYECPVAFYNSWSEALKATDKKTKFHISPEKFAKAYKMDTDKIMEALERYIEHGCGKFQRPQTIERIKNSILSFCQTAQNGSSGSKIRHARVNSTRAIVIQNYSAQASNIISHPYPDPNENIDPNVQNNRPTPVVAFHTGVEAVNASEEMNGQLHLLLATRVEPATSLDIENLNHGLDENNVTYVEHPYQPDDPRREFRVRLVTPDGQSTVVPYREIQGRILADTGSTTTLIDEAFARTQGLRIETSPYQVLLRDVNNGEQIVSRRCYLRLHLTTITGSQVVVTILALCVPDLSHDLLLGTKDLERYQVSVSPHMGQARMNIGNEEVSFPMLNDYSITQLQNLSWGTNRSC
jgi:hypothetical protein